MEIDYKVEAGKVAYGAYGKVTGYKNYQGLPMPEWEELTPNIQAAWIAAAREVMGYKFLKDVNEAGRELFGKK